MFNRLLVAALVVSHPCSASAAVIKRHATDLDRTYDFVIAGGGTAGLTIADRVSAAFPNRESSLCLQHKSLDTPKISSNLKFKGPFSWWRLEIGILARRGMSQTR